MFLQLHKRPTSRQNVGLDSEKTKEDLNYFNSDTSTHAYINLDEDSLKGKTATKLTGTHQ